MHESLGSRKSVNPLTPLPFKAKLSLAITTATILLTIILWCLTTTGHLTPHLGNIGIASLPCLVILFSTGQLHLQDWLRLPWDIVMLAMGGSALTLIAQQSGLMPALASVFALKLSMFSLWTQHLFACTAIAVLASISSRFIAALVYCPSWCPLQRYWQLMVEAVMIWVVDSRRCHLCCCVHLHVLQGWRCQLVD